MHGRVVAILREAGHEVEWIAESTPGWSDLALLDRSDLRDAILLTYDSDFGDLVFNQGRPVPLGIAYSRMGRAAPDLLAARLLELLATNAIAGHMVVIGPDRIRTRPLPTGRADA